MNKIKEERHCRTVTALPIFLIILLIMLIMPVSACTTILVGADVSEDGSRIIARSVDYIAAPAMLTYIPECTDEGTRTYESTSSFRIEVPLAGASYIMTPMMPSLNHGVYGEAAVNSYNVSISATESISSNEKVIAADPFNPKGIGEEDIPTLIIPYISSAREGVLLLGNKIEEYGSRSSEGVIFADENETWYMEIYTGHQWAAMKVPENCCAVIANSASIREVDLTDTENVLSSEGIIEIAKKAGTYSVNNEKPDLAASYSDAPIHTCEMREWHAMELLAPSLSGDFYSDYNYPGFFKPEHKIGLNEVMELLRDRFEDTMFNASVEYTRPIAVFSTSSSHIIQYRENKPTIFWFALAAPENSVFVPMYTNLNSVPESYSIDAAEYNRNSACWIFREICTLVETNHDKYSRTARNIWHDMELTLIAGIKNMDESYDRAGRSPEAASELFKKITDEALDAAADIQSQLMTDFVRDTEDASINRIQTGMKIDYGKQSSNLDSISSLIPSRF